MKFCFPNIRLRYRKDKEDFVWWEVGLSYPYVFSGREYGMLDDVRDVVKVSAPTEIKYEKSEYWHSFKITILGFGIYYASQWGY